MRIAFTLNGEAVEVEARSDGPLVEVLRGLGLTGTKEACGVGACGVCTVLVGDLPVSACLYLAASLDGDDVWTVEGLASRDARLADAFVACEGMQCGICTPGMVVSAFALRAQAPSTDRRRAREFMGGNLCRCTGYATVLAAVEAYLGAP